MAKVARDLAFELFNQGRRPSNPEVKALNLKSKTTYNYFQEWKKQGGITLRVQICTCRFDAHKDFYYDCDLKYPHALYLLKCHECHILYEVMPVITSYRARVLESAQLG